MDVIHDAEAHLTAEEIITYVQSRMPGVHKSTIYRTLEILEEAGCVYKSELSDHFIYHHAEGGHHHHLVCSQCGRVVDFSGCDLSGMEQRLSRETGYIIEGHLLELHGRCPDCCASAGIQ